MKNITPTMKTDRYIRIEPDEYTHLLNELFHNNIVVDNKKNNTIVIHDKNGNIVNDYEIVDKLEKHFDVDIGAIAYEPSLLYGNADTVYLILRY